MSITDMLYELLADIQFVYAFDVEDKESMTIIANRRFGETDGGLIMKEILSNDS